MIMGEVEKCMRQHDTSVEKVITEVMVSSHRKGMNESDASWEAWQELVFGWDAPKDSAKRLVREWLEDNVYDD